MSNFPLIAPQIRRRFRPVVDGRLTVTLPGESLLARGAAIADNDSVVAELDHAPMMTGRSHFYRKGAFVPCRRAVDALGVEVWEAVSERDLNTEAAMQVLERTRPDPTPPKPEPTVANAEAQIAPPDPTPPIVPVGEPQAAAEMPAPDPSKNWSA
jgi:hypothetical protein